MFDRIHLRIVFQSVKLQLLLLFLRRDHVQVNKDIILKCRYEKLIRANSEVCAELLILDDVGQFFLEIAPDFFRLLLNDIVRVHLYLT